MFAVNFLDNMKTVWCGWKPWKTLASEPWVGVVLSNYHFQDQKSSAFTLCLVRVRGRWWSGLQESNTDCCGRRHDANCGLWCFMFYTSNHSPEIFPKTFCGSITTLQLHTSYSLHYKVAFCYWERTHTSMQEVAGQENVNIVNFKHLNKQHFSGEDSLQWECPPSQFLVVVSRNIVSCVCCACVCVFACEIWLINNWRRNTDSEFNVTSEVAEEKKKNTLKVISLLSRLSFSLSLSLPIL